MADIRAVLAKQGRPACGAVIRAITKAAGYRWRKGRFVLTSSDSKYAEKLAHIRLILSGLGPDEAFFSIDEFGPFAVKAKPGRVLAAPGEEPQVAKWQKSKGCLIITAALELSRNQVTHFYSIKKDTREMIRMMDLPLDRYHDRRKLSCRGTQLHGTFRSACSSGSRRTTRRRRNPAGQLWLPRRCRRGRSF